MSNTVEVNGTQFELKPMKAAQIAALSNIIGRLTLDGRKLLKDIGPGGDATDFIWGLLAAVTEKELVKLAALVIGSDETFAAENFDLVWVTEALATQIEISNIGKIITNFTRLSSLAVS